jgi:hypothetical protein
MYYSKNFHVPGGCVIDCLAICNSGSAVSPSLFFTAMTTTITAEELAKLREKALGGKFSHYKLKTFSTQLSILSLLEIPRRLRDPYQ